MSTLSLQKHKSIRAALALSLAAALPASALLAPAPVAAAQGDLDKAVAALRGISTMKADFVQTDRSGQTVRGVMTLKRPGKIRFEYEKGVPMLVVSNGKSMYMVDYEVNQVQRWPIENSPLGALLDPSRDVKRFGKLVPTSHPDVVSVEVRDTKRPEFGVITLIFARDAASPGGLRLTHWVALDSQNHRTTVRLANQRYGVAVADSAFTFRDPRRSSRRPG
ncbi:MAG: outer membrane lipoprotein carrier protein LolA [Erythrobacter sp.]|jgi:outer membrane lipoprotein-sorting protein|uniref:LolA family protein n=1 Tax=Qipengyuania TaxID=1855416 RepID=UPI001A628935|nr:MULTISPECIES: outer membrane lipoprotein carrier protein LolA [Qipengyuania]MBL4719143.1 outer membrane lipoprotein carrier protein LolA [Erythrobacter sp.]MDE0901807.1 outer membrane lipoprotein carrier protein LolA [Erythrobacter sp.]UYH54714.1 outer membrane lipoprotein carrier protein LolA [Qipengyuania sp. SS22]|tara:strand:- start:101496 stop:102158 length:663 start_codon:yes stop_codon:yes gene_type:complete